jgi:hypothetical protein
MLRRSGGGKEKTPARRMSEWSPETELLSVVADRLAELIQATAAGRGAKPRPITPSPRPAGAMERVRYRERIRKHNALVARVLPHKHHEQGR